MNFKSILLSFALGLNALCLSIEPSDTKLKMLYNSLDPHSISQHLAFYELYSPSAWGQQALKDAWKLLAGLDSNQQWILPKTASSSQLVDILVSMVNKPIDQEPALSDRQIIEALSKLATRLKHSTLKGHSVWTEQEVWALPLEEIDLARGLFISQFGSDRQRIQSYEALIDLMALQILARLSPFVRPEEKIIAINRFIFDEMGFRFPPHSLYAQDIDLYTFLPSVLDSRRGVCLGVSILYLCLAQRLALPLEMITPPGHIYVRYHSGDKIVNIETTARGVDMDSEEYLSINTCSLQQRTIREVIGMSHFNQASVYWQNGEYDKALAAYQKAEPYMRGDPLLKEFMGYVLLLIGRQQEGEQFLEEIRNFVPDYALVNNTMADDYFKGQVDAKGIGVIFTKVDEDRKSILAKKQALEETLERYPHFRAGILSLAITWLQLHRAGEALETLHTYQSLDATNPEVHYYLSVIYAQRHDFTKAWFHLHQVEAISKVHQYDSKILKELRRELVSCCPE